MDRSIRSLWASPRVRIWGATGLALLGAILLLVLAPRGGGKPKDTPPTGEPERVIHVRIVNHAGTPLEAAKVFVAQEPGAPSGGAGRWSTETATLTLPDTGEPRSVVVQARGHQTLQIDDIRTDRTVFLPLGHLVRFRLTARAPLPPPPLHVVLQIQPDPPAEAAFSEAERNTLVDLVSLSDPSVETHFAVPRQHFGYAVSMAEAEGGIRLPMAGTWVVRWGLLHESEGVWFSPEKGARLSFAVTEPARPRALDLAILPEALEAARLGLAERIAALRAE